MFVLESKNINEALSPVKLVTEFPVIESHTIFWIVGELGSV